MIAAYRRDRGGAGARNHLLVVPAVVCATHVAAAIGRSRAAANVTAIVHQHGCLHVGDDLSHTAATLEGVAVNPNIAAALVVSLGCETLQGRRLAGRISSRGQRVAFVGIQSSGGTTAAVTRGLEALESLERAAATDVRQDVDPHEVVIGVDGVGPIPDAIVRRLTLTGIRVIRPVPQTGSGAHTYPDLAARGAALVVAVLGSDAAPLGFAICPVINVATDPQTATNLADDIDVDASAVSSSAAAEAVAEQVATVLQGEPSATERAGARGFVLRRLAVTM